jgi:ParB-like chromosome segregation protein Spo0J
MRILEQDYTLIPIDKIDPHPFNPNEGNRDALDDSVDVNGFYGAVTVRAKADSDRFELIAGEHRWRKLVDEGVIRIPAIVVEGVDDVAAMRMMLADNEVNRRGKWKKNMLAQVLEELGSFEGTGFDLSKLQEAEEEREAEDVPEDDPGGDSGEPSTEVEYGVMVYAADEAEQEAFYNLLAEEYGADKVRRISI